MSAILRTSFEVVSLKPGGPAYSQPLHDELCRAIVAGDESSTERAALKLIEQAESDLYERIKIEASTN